MQVPDETARALLARANAAMAMHREGRLAEAERAYRDLVPQVEHPSLLSNFGALLVQTKRAAEAVPVLERAVAIAGDRTSPLTNLAAALRDLGRLDEAEACLHQLLAARPDDPGALGMLGLVLTGLRRLEEAERHLLRACEIRPDDPDHHFALGLLRREQADLSGAVACYHRVLDLVPDHPGALDNLATALGDLGALEEALSLQRRLLALQPDRHDVRFWHGNTLVAAGRWAEGWAAYEARRRYLPSCAPPPGMTAPFWSGAPLSGGTLLLYGEQGIGDVLMMVRFLPRVLARATRIVLAVHPPLVPLLAPNAPDRVEVVPLHAVPGKVDAALPLMSLMSILGLVESDLDGAPYLAADDALRRHWRARLPDATGPRIGLVWAGNPGYIHDRFRSPGLAAVQPLLDRIPARWIVLQVGPGRAQIQSTPLPPDLCDVGAEVRDFADTAAILSELDLLVTSDTAAAHLAGALGVRCHVMAPALLDWRWAQAADGRSRWYRSVRVHRQPTLGDWGTVVAEVADALTT